MRERYRMVSLSFYVLFSLTTERKNQREIANCLFIKLMFFFFGLNQRKEPKESSRAVAPRLKNFVYR